MKSYLPLVLLMLLAQGVFSLDQGQKFNQVQGAFCWRNTFDSPDSVTSKQCPKFLTLINNLCYRICSPDEKRSPIQPNTCAKNCPQSFDLIFPKNGKPICQQLDKSVAFTNQNACLQKTGKCYFGTTYNPVKKVNCKSLGSTYVQNDDYSCNALLNWFPTTTKTCGGVNQVYDNQLCYSVCGQGYFRMGKVCWQKAPQEWVECGLAIAQTNEDCATVKYDDDIINFGYQAVSFLMLFSKQGTSYQTSFIFESFNKVLRYLQESIRLRNMVIQNLSNPKLKVLIEYSSSPDITATTSQELIAFIEDILAIVNPTGKYNKLQLKHPICRKP